MIDRAHLEAKRGEHTHYVVPTTGEKRCCLCLGIWPCEQSEILDLALDGIEMRARVNVDAPYSSMMQRTDEWQRAAIEDRKRAEGYRKALEDCIEALCVEDNRLRRQHPDPDFAHMVQSLGERIGYGVVMTEASRLWFEQAGSGAFSVGHCIAIQESAWEAARAALEETR